ncbi:protein KRBA1 isoform X4 [Mesoplodon densirostris]|uniref:protein KRBA1 isoform X4 n=1 Tax=Mesoplodon densirostris TaxID=48708 RepID=UPI0028DB5E37|nr:protein KRBA1 isoform X4 [Mesoplodon densirostris]
MRWRREPCAELGASWVFYAVVSVDRTRVLGVIQWGPEQTGKTTLVPEVLTVPGVWVVIRTHTCTGAWMAGAWAAGVIACGRAEAGSHSRGGPSLFSFAGTVDLLPLSAFLCPSEPGGAVGGGGCAADGQDSPRGGGPLGGAPQHSLHLSALVQLVKEIPEFLFGEVSPESGGASLDGEGASPEAAAVMGDTCPLRGLLGCLPDTPVGRPGLATMPSGSSSSSPPRARGQGSPLPIKTADTPRPVEEESPGAPSQEPSPPTRSPSRQKSHRNQETGATGTGAAGISPGNNPLQGLINYLKEILEPGPQHPEQPLSLPPPVAGLGATQLTRAELQPGSPPWAVKTETASGDCPLQSLLNCLKEIPEARDKQPSPSGARDPRLQEDPGAWKRNSGGPRPLQTPPPGPGAGSVLSAVKVEDGWARGPPEPASCQLSKRTHGPSAAGSPGDNGGTAWVRVPSWGSAARAGSASSSPLEALEACLRGIPLSGSLPSQPPASSWSRSPQPGDPGSQRPELQRLGSQSKGSQGTPASFSSSSSIDGDLDFQSPEGSQGHRPGKGSPVGSSPLQGLENCLREIPAPGPQPTWSCSSAGHRGPWRVEPKNWTAGMEGLRGEAWEPAHLGQRGGDVPTRSLRLASPQALASGTIPACHQRGPKDPGAARPGPWRWLPDGPATKPSPLHCLENSLKGILPGGPLRFTCLADPVPGPSPSPSSSSSSSSSSSISSSEGEDPRLEPELWQPLLQEGDRLPSCKGLGPPSPRPGGPRTGSSPGEGQRRGKTGDHRGLSAAGKAEEKVRGWSHPPWREVCLENLGPPGPLGSAGGGHVQIPPVRVALGKRCVSTPQMLCALPAGAAVGPRPAFQLEKRLGSGPCQPPGSACGPLSWNPTAGEEFRGLRPGDGSPGVTAGTHPRPLPGDPPGPPPGAAIPWAMPRASPRPPCPCGSSLQHELRSLGAALSEKLDRLAGALAGLAQEVAAVRTQVDRLGRRPWGSGTKGLLRGPRWTGGPAHRHAPYWRHKGPRRPRPKILRGQAEGCRAGDSSALASAKPRLMPQLPPDVPLAEASGPSSGPLSSACGSPAVLTVCHPLGRPEGHRSPPPPLLPAVPPPQVAASAAEPRAAAAAPPRTLKWPKDPSSLLAGLQRALDGELWGGEHRDPAWGSPSRHLNGLHPAEDAPPLAASSGGRPPPSAPCSRTFPVSGL